MLKPLPDSVTKGPVAPAFGQQGGGGQYYFDKPIQWYIDEGYLGGPDAIKTGER